MTKQTKTKTEPKMRYALTLEKGQSGETLTTEFASLSELASGCIAIGEAGMVKEGDVVYARRLK